MQVGLAHEIFFVLLAALIGGLSARLLKLAPIIGYIVGGVIFGGVFGVRGSQVATLAEIGAILLLFSTGIELSLTKLSRVVKIAVFGAIIQIILVTALVYLLLLPFGLGGLAGLILAFAFSLSSTAVIVKTLAERGEGETLYGEIMIGWSLVQDLAIIPVMVLLPVVVSPGGGGILGAAFGALFKATIVLAATLFLGKLVAPYLIRKVSGVNSRELLILSAVTLALGTAALTSLFGISPILGAFLAGVVISESQENHAVLAETRPLRDLFVALFFVTLGFFVTPGFILPNLFLIVSLAAFVIIVKFVVVFLITVLFKYHGRTALPVSLGLAQVGEFAFVILSYAAILGVVDEKVTSIGIAVALVTLLVSPMVYKANLSLWKRIRAFAAHSSLLSKIILGTDEKTLTGVKEYSNHIIICGYGRVGSWVGKALESLQIPFVVVDYNREVTGRLKSSGVEVIYGDPTEKEIIEAAGVRKAKAIVLAIPDEMAQEEIVAYVQNVNPKAKLLSRVHRDEDFEKLKILKVNKLVQPEFEGAISIVRSILSSMGKSREEINQRTKKLRLSHARS